MNVLIVDDERHIRQLMGKYLATEGIDSQGAENGLSAQRMLEERPFDACLVDLKMPGMDGLELIRWIREAGYRMPVIMMSAHGEIRDAVTALKEGAADYIEKPFDPEELCLRLAKLIETQRVKNLLESKQREEKTPEGLLIGSSPAMKSIRQMIAKIGKRAATVLITGESGTGKEVVARTIHTLSDRSTEPFVPINIGGVPEQLLESELFGYERGAFTGAEKRKPGMFEIASGGTLFLDEIGEMPPTLQVKLLRVLQERKITRLGGLSQIPIDARIIAATNRDLETLVREGTFREDLFYRLNVVRMEVPPLRERKEDIPELTASILAKLNRQMGLSVRGLDERAYERLMGYSFPGNVRELENILERAILFTEEDEITEDELELRGIVFHEREEVVYQPVQNDLLGAVTLKELEMQAIIRALHRHEGNRTHTAAELGISRRTLINKIAEYGLEL